MPLAVCRYDLTDGPLKLNAPVSQAYTSVTFYTRNGVAYYAINDRAAGRRAIELDLMTPEQRAQLPEEEDVTAADRLIIESPTTSGLIVLRALAPEPGLMPMARRRLPARNANCNRIKRPVILDITPGRTPQRTQGGMTVTPAQLDTRSGSLDPHRQALQTQLADGPAIDRHEIGIGKPGVWKAREQPADRDRDRGTAENIADAMMRPDAE